MAFRDISTAADGVPPSAGAPSRWGWYAAMLVWGGASGTLASTCGTAAPPVMGLSALVSSPLCCSTCGEATIARTGVGTGVGTGGSTAEDSGCTAWENGQGPKLSICSFFVFFLWDAENHVLVMDNGLFSILPNLHLPSWPRILQSPHQ